MDYIRTNIFNSMPFRVIKNKPKYKQLGWIISYFIFSENYQMQNIYYIAF